MSQMSAEAQAFEQRKATTGCGFEHAPVRTPAQLAAAEAKHLILEKGMDWDSAIRQACGNGASPEVVWYVLKADQCPRNKVTGLVEKAW